MSLYKEILYRLWKFLLKQRFDFSAYKMALTFAGEAGTDTSGFFREFLTMNMKYFAKCPDSFFGSESSLLYNLTPKWLEQNKYYILGQLITLAFLCTGRGPQCVHPIIVPAMYGQEINRWYELKKQVTIYQKWNVMNIYLIII